MKVFWDDSQRFLFFFTLKKLLSKQQEREAKEYILYYVFVKKTRKYLKIFVVNICTYEMLHPKQFVQFIFIFIALIDSFNSSSS